MRGGPARLQAPMKDVDARELDGFDQDHAPAEVEAALWATRRREGLEAGGDAALAAWLAVDPGHGERLAALEASFERVRQLPGERFRRVAGSTCRALSADGRRPLAARARRRWWPRLAAAGLACVVILGGWLGWTIWSRQPTFLADYRTGQGERLPIQLPDGSRVLLDAVSELEVRLYRHKRTVRQLAGQAMYSVAPRPEQPFEVLAGAVQVRVIGTRFAVRRDPDLPGGGADTGRVEVSVETGRVQLRKVGGRDPGGEDGDPPGLELTAGQMVSTDAAGRFQPPRPIAAGAVAPWRKGRVVFNDTPLVDALAELGRYGETGLVVLDPEVAAMRLGGSFDLARLAAFADALPHLLPVRLERRDDRTEIVRRR